MKRQLQMKYHRAMALALTVALLPLSGRAMASATTATDTGAVSPKSNSTTTAPDTKLTPPTKEVVKLVNSGVPEKVVKAYVENTSSTFNLTPDAIIDLRGMGVSEALVVDMLSHDKTLRDNSRMAASSVYQTPTTPEAMLPGTPYSTYGQPQDNGYASIPPDYYDQTAPYGDYSGYYGYGYPYGSYAYYPYYNAYPWGGYNGWGWGGWGWGWWPGIGWTWFPRSHFRDFDHHRDFDDHSHFRDFDHQARFHDFDRHHDFDHQMRFRDFDHRFANSGRNFNGQFNHPRTFGTHPFVMNHSVSTFRGGFNPGMVHGGMGHSGVGHMSGGGHSGGMMMGGGGHGGGGGHR